MTDLIGELLESKKEIERLRLALMDIHDDLEATYPFQWYFDEKHERPTTREDYEKAFDKINRKAMAALYPEDKGDAK